MNARDCALQVLTACRRSGAWADAALKAALAKGELSPQDAALASRIVYGVLQNRMYLDRVLSAYCTQRLEHLQQPLADILRIGAYQILFLDKIPASAAVSEAVEQSRRCKRAAAAGLVNAVLRKLAANKTALPPLPDDPVERLCVETSHPRWLVERMTALLGAEGAAAFCRANNEVSPLTVQVNPLRTDIETLRRELTALGVRVQAHPWAEGCLELSGTGDLTTLPPFYRGEMTVQDSAAHLVARVAACAPGQRVLDVCAAPGGKSFAAAFAMRDEGSILACDLHENKLKRIREGAQRLGLTSIETAAADARRFRAEWEKAFDVVICDVPCSGLGIIRKKPDIRCKDPAALGELPAIQLAILSNAARYVKENGLLVYSTCTVLPEENEGVTDAFLAAHPAYAYEAFTLPDPIGAVPGRITLWPQVYGTDGFYLSRIRRSAHD